MHQSAEESSGKVGIIDIAARIKLEVPKHIPTNFTLP